MPAIADAVRNGLGGNIGLVFGIAFLIVGIGFKFGAVPFHMWIPDVYEGSPTCVTVFIGTASKLAAFALAMRLLPEALAGSQADWSQMLVVLSVLSMAIGNIVAIAQTNLKRMLAYSTISHVGYVLLGILSGTAQGYQAAMFYMISYVLVAAGVLRHDSAAGAAGFRGGPDRGFPRTQRAQSVVRGHDGDTDVQSGGSAALHRFLGEARRHSGGPRRVNYTWLAVVAVLFSVVGAFFYLRIVKLMYFDEPTETAAIGGSVLMRTVLSANALLAFGLGVIPGTLLQLCQAGPAVGAAMAPVAARAGGGRWDSRPAPCIGGITRYNGRLFRCGVEQSGSSSGS